MDIEGPSSLVKCARCRVCFQLARRNADFTLIRDAESGQTACVWLVGRMSMTDVPFPSAANVQVSRL